MTVLKIAVIAALIILAVLYVCCTLCCRVFRRNWVDMHLLPPGEQYEKHTARSHALIDEAAAHPYEDVYTRSRDGLTLHAQMYEAGAGKPVQILCHGYRSNAIRDHCGGLNISVGQGYNTLLIDQRAHGKSGGKYLTFGIMERYDIAQWVKFASARWGKDVPIVLTGISMGAASVLMASELKMSGNVVGIISDSGYTTPRAIVRDVIKKLHLPVVPFYALVRAGCRLFAGFDLNDGDTRAALSKTDIPVLFIHGEDDRFVPCAMTLENYAACRSDKTLLTVPNAGHGLSFMEDEASFVGAVRAFLARVTASAKND